MSSKYGSIWIWFALVLDAIFTAMLIILFKFKVINIKLFFVLIILLIIIFIVLLLIQIISIFNYSEEHVTNDKKNYSNQMFRIRSRINKFLSERPNGDTINWDSGRYGREEIRTFSAPNGGTKEFYGVSAMTSHYRKWVVMIYSIDKQDIIKYVADPSVDLLNDPFFGFKFMDTGREPTDLGFGRRDDYGYGGQQHIHIGSQEARRREGVARAKNDSEKAYEALKRT